MSNAIHWQFVQSHPVRNENAKATPGDWLLAFGLVLLNHHPARRCGDGNTFQFSSKTDQGTVSI